MNKVYIICKTHFEYNDETYNAAGEGRPIVFYTDRNVAEMDCAERNLKSIDSDLENYGYDLDEILTDEGYKVLDKLGLADADPWGWGDEFYTEFVKLTKSEQLDFARNGLRNPFYSVYEVERG